MVIRLIQGIFPFLISMFIGPWTDTNGRKPFMVLTMAGYGCFSGLWAILSLFPKMSPYFFIIPSLPLSITGGQLALYLCCYCYISDITDPANRTVRFSIMNSSSMMGSLAGSCFVIAVEKLSSSKDVTYLLIFCCCTLIAFFALIFSVSCIEETVYCEKKEMDFILNMDFAKSVASCLFKKSTKDLIITLLTVFMLFFDIAIKKGEKVILYLVGLEQFSWSLSYYNLFSAAIILISALTSSAVSIILKKWLGWQNLSIILFSSTLVISTEILRAMSRSEIEFWVSSAFNTIATITAPAVSAEISTLADKEDIGKIYAFSALVDSLVPFIAISLYSEMYRILVHSQQTLYVYLLSASSSFLIGASVIILLCLKKSKSYSPNDIKAKNEAQ